MRFTFVQRAGEHEGFAATAFDSQIGTEVRMTLQDEPAGRATLVAAEVAEGGRSVELQFETADRRITEHLKVGTLREMSFAPGGSLKFVLPPAWREDVES